MRSNRLLISAERGQRAFLAAALVVLLALANSCDARVEQIVSPTPSASASTAMFEGPREEYLPRLADCLRGAGWNVQLDADGGMSLQSLTAEQRPAFIAAKDACEQQIGTLPPPEPLSEQQIRNQYAYLLEVRQCLQKLGYTISEPPTVDAFTDSWATGPWSPYDDLEHVSQQQWTEANQKCPQTPSDDS